MPDSSSHNFTFNLKLLSMKSDVLRVHYILEHGHPPPDPSFGSSKLCDSPCSLSSPSASYVSSALNEDERKNTDLSKDHSSLSLRSNLSESSLLIKYGIKHIYFPLVSIITTLFRNILDVSLQ